MALDHKKLDMPWRDYDVGWDCWFMVRTCNCLKNAGIITMRQLLQLTPKDILRIKNAGRKTLADIVEGLAEGGMSLGMDLTPPPEISLVHILQNAAGLLTGARITLMFKGEEIEFTLTAVQNKT